MTNRNDRTNDVKSGTHARQASSDDSATIASDLAASGASHSFGESDDNPFGTIDYDRISNAQHGRSQAAWDQASSDGSRQQARRQSLGRAGRSSGGRSQASGDYRGGGGIGAQGSANVVRVRKKKRKRHTGAFVALAVVLVLVVALGASGFALYESAKAMKADASSIMSDVNAVQKAISSQDYATAQSSAESLAAKADELCASLDSPLWNAATFIPGYGEDVKSVKTLASVLEDASENALIPLTKALEQTPPSSLMTSEGDIDVASLEVLLASLQEAAPVMQRCADQVNALPAMRIESLSSTVTSAKTKLNEINDLFQQVNEIAPVIGSLLGGEGQRTYLLVAQNTAEIRPAGGFPGSIGLVTIDNGHIDLGEFGSIWKVMETTMPESITITEEEYSVFPDYALNKPCDEGENPDFPRVAEVWAAAYEETNGVHVDGVITMTPAIIQKILGVVGGITLSDGSQVDGSNAAKVLQHDLYWEYFELGDTGGNEITDALFAETAQLTFDKMIDSMSGSVLNGLADVFLSSMEDRTLMMWMEDAEEQSQLVSMGASGAICTDAAHPQIGVFCSDFYYTKLGWYVDMNTTVLRQSSQADGSSVYQVQVKLGNALSSDDIANLRKYVTGSHEGTMILRMYLFAPVGGTMSSISASNGTQFETSEYKGAPVSFAEVEIDPGETVLLTYTVTTSSEAVEEPTVVSTPTLEAYR